MVFIVVLLRPETNLDTQCTYSYSIAISMEISVVNIMYNVPSKL